MDQLTNDLALAFAGAMQSCHTGSFQARTIPLPAASAPEFLISDLWALPAHHVLNYRSL